MIVPNEWQTYSYVSYGFTEKDAYLQANDASNLENISTQLRLKGTIKTVHQTHSTKIVVVDHPTQLTSSIEADGLITQLPEVMLAIKTADCVPILLFDPIKRVIGAVHSGWKGTRDQIVLEAIFRMQEHFDCKNKHIEVMLGACLRPCCFEIQADVAQFFDPSFITHQSNRQYLNQTAKITHDLVKIGITKIVDTNLCSFCHADRFFSYRREKPHRGNLYSFIHMSATYE